MKKHFITGLITLLPVAVTVTIVFFIINFLTQPFLGFFEPLLQPLAEGYQGVLRFSLQVVLLFLLFFSTVLLGFLTRWLIFKYFLSLSDALIHRIPLIKTVYKTCQQIIHTIFGDQSRSFKQVVLVPFPTPAAYSIGLVSSPASPICERATEKELISVFVPTTPNPTSGFLMMYEKKDVIFIDMKIDDALKYIISCGVVTTDPTVSTPSLTPIPAPIPPVPASPEVSPLDCKKSSL
jgi:uncharacterized membrane protein